MTHGDRHSPRPLPSLRPLAACLAAALGIANAAPADGPRPADTIVVTNCNDSGAGSLRAAVQGNVSGDPIDLTQLACSQITLVSGAIHTSHSQTLNGPGSGLLAIDGNGNDRVLVEEAGTATLAIRGMTLQNGRFSSSSGGDGGCLYAAGNLALTDVAVTGCRVLGTATTSGLRFSGGGLAVGGNLTANDSRIVGNEINVASAAGDGGGISMTGGWNYAELVNTTVSGNSVQVTGSSTGFNYARGGGIFAGENISLRLTDCTISGNTLSSVDGSHGGGVLTFGGMELYYSTVSDNHADGSLMSIGGGLLVVQNVFIENSTVSGNTAYWDGGVFSIRNADVTNSTISGNTAGRTGGLEARRVAIISSTIVFNVETAGAYGAGVSSYYRPTVQGSIIAGNTSPTPEQHNIWISRVQQVNGANNLIGESDGVPLPPDTIQSDPMLAPLADNGGPTLTHALLPGSPAIDAGNNIAQADWDQRGEGYPRVLGPAPDIGAFESTPDLPPVAEDDHYATTQDTTLSVGAPGVLGNDADPEGDAMTAVLVDDVSNGQLTLQADGSFVYVPAPGFFGADHFTYEASDGTLPSNIATVTIEVLQDTDDLVFANGFD